MKRIFVTALATASIFIASPLAAQRDFSEVEITSEELDAHITPALSGLSVLSNYQLKGYVLMPN